MRIAIDASAIGSAPSGARVRMVNLLRAYAGLPGRHDVVVMAAASSRLAEELVPHGVACVDVEPAPPAAERALRTSRFWKNRLDRIGADALCAETLPVPRDPGRPLLLTVHDLRAAAGPIWSPRRLYVRLGLRRALWRVRRVIAVSRYTAAEIERLGVPPDRISVVANAPDESVAPLEDAPFAEVMREAGVRRPFVLALGHVEPRKNLKVLVDAVAIARARRLPDLALVVVGWPARGQLPYVSDEERRLTARARRLDVPLICCGGATDEGRSWMLSAASCVAVPSRIEGFGIVPLEAMKVGTPVVCSNAGALPEVVGDAAPLLDPDDAEGFAREIERLVLDPDAREEARRRGFARAREFTWERAARALKEAHDAVAESISRGAR